MGIMSRLSRLFTADAHAVLDRLEEPETLLRQALREMESALAAQAQQLRLLEQESAQVQRRSNEVDSALARIDEELGLSFAAGQTALIRQCLRRQLENQRLRKCLQQRSEQLGQRLEQNRAALAEHSERLDSMRQQAAVFDVRCDASRQPFGCSSAEEFCVSEADIDLALLREQQARRPS